MTKPTRIAMWSGPRNISTTMMRAFGNRNDTFASDEPFYGYFLKSTNIDHPMKDEVISKYQTNWSDIKDYLTGPIPNNKPIWYQKQMTQHLLPDDSIEWTRNVTNCFLIRDPKDVIISYAKIYDKMTPDLLGFPQLLKVFNYTLKNSEVKPIVINSRSILKNPKSMLNKLCQSLDITFSNDMLSWDEGPKDYEGIWGKHWYKQLHLTTGFIKYEKKDKTIPDSLLKLYNECNHYYKQIKEYQII